MFDYQNASFNLRHQQNQNHPKNDQKSPFPTFPLSKTKPISKYKKYTKYSLNSPFIIDLPIKNGDFP